MTLAFVADAHLWNHAVLGGPVEGGVNRRARLVLGALERAVGGAANQGCTNLFLLGDLSHGVKPEAQLLARLIYLLRAARDDYGLRIHALLGNHERDSDARGDHALGPLLEGGALDSLTEDRGIVEVLDGRGRCGAAVLMLSFAPGASAEESIAAALEEAPWPPTDDAVRILCMHWGVKSDDEHAPPPWLQDSREGIHVDRLAELCARRRVSHVFAGHWHWHASWASRGVRVVQVGALAPRGFADADADCGSYVVLDDRARVMRQRVDGPRFYSFAAPSPEWDAACRDGLGPLAHVSVTTTRAAKAEAAGALGSMVSYGLALDGKVRLDRAEASRAARRSARVVRAADTLGKAVGEYVAGMPLEDGVDRGEVLDMVRGYLGI